MFEGSVTIRSSTPARSMAVRVRARRPAYSSRAKGSSTALMVPSPAARAPAPPLPASPPAQSGRGGALLVGSPGAGAAPPRRLPRTPPSGPAGRVAHALSQLAEVGLADAL